MNQLMQRELSTFSLPQHVRFRLHSNGFTTVEDLHNIGPVELAAETELSQEEAVETLQLIFGECGATSSENKNISSITALDLLTNEKSKPPIPTFCHELDNVLGGGIPLKKLTELCGAPGSGKTQMCMQLCSNVQIPEACGGLDGEAIFIDTEGSFVVDRLVQIVDATVETCTKIMKNTDSSFTDDTFCTETILNRIHYFLCKNYTELIARVNLLPEFLKEHPKVRLLVIDSISFHFRYGFEESYILRARLLSGLSQSLVKIANEFDIAVVLTNQMTTRMKQDGESSLVPALGESWGHACTTRLILSYEEDRRQAYLFKSPWRKEATASYKIMTCGIRDNKNPNKKEKLSASCQEGNANKKAKLCD